jgi:hypothetical protein
MDDKFERYHEKDSPSCTACYSGFPKTHVCGGRFHAHMKEGRCDLLEVQCDSCEVRNEWLVGKFLNEEEEGDV